MDITDLGFEAECSEVAAHLGNLGWQPVGTAMRQLLAIGGLAAIEQDDGSVSVANTVYYSSVWGD
ncbi:hypothetical protein [Mycobacterium sp. HNNTM2301]|uniref:hypothetical protein n=1 Tax=Mycobacterium hainanense TaxID=3289775 RepID=UPI0035A5ADBD